LINDTGKSHAVYGLYSDYAYLFILIILRIYTFYMNCSVVKQDFSVLCF